VSFLHQTASFELLCAKIGSRVWAVALLKNIKTKNKKTKSHSTRICWPHVASRPLIVPKPNLAWLITSITLSLTPNFKSIEIKLCLWRSVEVLCFSTTEADAINTAKPCRAACDWNREENRQETIIENEIDNLLDYDNFTGTFSCGWYLRLKLSENVRESTRFRIEDHHLQSSRGLLRRDIELYSIYKRVNIDLHAG